MERQERGKEGGLEDRSERIVDLGARDGEPRVVENIKNSAAYTALAISTAAAGIALFAGTIYYISRITDAFYGLMTSGGP